MDSQWVRLVLAVSLDGRLAMPHGGKAHLGSIDDRRVLEESLAWADAALIGGGTLRAHHTTCLIQNYELIKKRKSQGLPEQPISIVISSQKNFCPDWPFFHQPIERWLITGQSQPKNNKIIYNYERELMLNSNWVKTFQQLKEEGLKKILVLGGAKLVGSLLNADQIDELQLTLTPKIIGGEYTWVPSQMKDLPENLREPNCWELIGSSTLGHNELLLRYFRNHSSDEINAEKKSKFVKNQ